MAKPENLGVKIENEEDRQTSDSAQMKDQASNYGSVSCGDEKPSKRDLEASCEEVHEQELIADTAAQIVQVKPEETAEEKETRWLRFEDDVFMNDEGKEDPKLPNTREKKRQAGENAGSGSGNGEGEVAKMGKIAKLEPTDKVPEPTHATPLDQLFSDLERHSPDRRLAGRQVSRGRSEAPSPQPESKPQVTPLSERKPLTFADLMAEDDPTSPPFSSFIMRKEAQKKELRGKLNNLSKREETLENRVKNGKNKLLGLEQQRTVPKTDPLFQKHRKAVESGNEGLRKVKEDRKRYKAQLERLEAQDSSSDGGEYYVEERSEDEDDDFVVEG